MTKEQYNEKLANIKTSNASYEVKTNAILDLEAKYHEVRHIPTIEHGEIKMGEF